MSVLIARHREGGGFLHPLSLCPRRFRDSWQRVPRAFGSIDSKTRPRKGRNIPDYDVTESERICWKGRLLITCRRKFGKTFRSFETICDDCELDRRKAVIIEKMLVLRIIVLSHVYYVSRRKRKKARLNFVSIGGIVSHRLPWKYGHLVGIISHSING